MATELPDDSGMYVQRESMTKEEYRRMMAEEEARAKKQAAEADAKEDAYRKKHGIPQDPKTHPGYYHMRSGRGEGGGGSSGGGAARGGGVGGGGGGGASRMMNPLKLEQNFADGGYVRQMTPSGLTVAGYGAPNEQCGHLGPGVRSRQDYKK